MKKQFFYPFILIVLVSLASCATNITKLNTSGSLTYKINAVGTSREIQTGALNRANNLCSSMNKDYRFIRNIILPKAVMGMDMISYSLIFSCVEPGSPQEQLPKAAMEETIPEDLSSPQPLPALEEKVITQEVIPEKSKKVATIAPLAYKSRKSGATGDTPGAPESLGNPPPSKFELENEEGEIIEEPIFE